MRNFDPALYLEGLHMSPVDTFYLKACIENAMARFPSAKFLVDIQQLLPRGHVPPLGPALKELAIDVPIIDSCNLQCDACTHRAALLKDAPPRPVDSIVADLERLAGIRHSFPLSIYILGGEPLLHPELPRILHIAAEILPHAHRCVTTNMLLYENGGEVEEALLETGTTLRYSDYPAFRNSTRLKVESALDAGVSVEISGESPARFNRYKASSSLISPLAQHQHCRGQLCPVLRDGTLWLCAYTGYNDAVNNAYGTALVAHPYDSVPLADIETLDEIAALLLLPHPSCRYCCVDVGMSWGCKAPEKSDFVV